MSRSGYVDDDPLALGRCRQAVKRAFEGKRVQASLMAPGDVARAFESGLVGAHRALRQFGIVITQVSLDQELMNMGIRKGIHGATEQQKVQARLNLIMKGTADALGDARRTAGP